MLGRRGDYFFVPLSLLFTYTSIVTISAAIFMITINSSYVLIQSPPPFGDGNHPAV